LSQAAVLVVDDEPGMRNYVTKLLGPRCRLVAEASDGRAASRLIEEQNFDVVILDNVLPGENGLSWLGEQRRQGFFSDVILMTAYADLDTAIEAVRAGVVDFILKPFRANQLLAAVSRCLDRLRLRRENGVLRQELTTSGNQSLLRSKLLGDSPAIEKVRKIIARVAPMSTSVLLTGQSGTGKEVAARSLHALSDRHGGLFVPINCGAIPAEMIESELFGHVKGAYTGAARNREGLFLHAHGGTIFLDEIGELPPYLQIKLLRVIEDRRVRPVGSERELPFDARFVFATNADLPEMVARGAFRSDLYFRLNVMQIGLPPLRDRGDDILLLADMFMREVSQDLGLPALCIDEAIRSALLLYEWPGNVRELRNLIERSIILGYFPDEFEQLPRAADASSSQSLASVEKHHILAVLQDAGGNREEAARRLGISRKTIDRKCTSWNV
jgi:DNA-binding NtrC family response regulator